MDTTPLDLRMSILNDFMHKMSFFMRNNLNLGLLQREFNRAFSLKYLCELLQSSVLCLNEKEVNKHKLKDVPEDEKEIIFPPGARECNTRDESIVETRDVDPEVVESHSLRSRLVAQDFDWVEGLERRIASGNHEAKNEDKCDLSFRGSGGLRHDCTFGGRVDVCSVDCCDDAEYADNDTSAD